MGKINNQESFKLNQFLNFVNVATKIAFLFFVGEWLIFILDWFTAFLHPYDMVRNHIKVAKAAMIKFRNGEEIEPVRIGLFYENEITK